MTVSYRKGVMSLDGWLSWESRPTTESCSARATSAQKPGDAVDLSKRSVGLDGAGAAETPTLEKTCLTLEKTCHRKSRNRDSRSRHSWWSTTAHTVRKSTHTLKSHKHVPEGMVKFTLSRTRKERPGNGYEEENEWMHSYKHVWRR